MRAASATLLTTLTAAALDVPLVSEDHGGMRAAGGAFTVSGVIGGAIIPAGSGSGTGGWSVQPGIQATFEKARHQSPAIIGGPASTDEDEAVDIAISATDPDTGDSLTPSLSTPAHGTLTDLGGGVIRYVPDDDFHGSDAFDVTTTDPVLGGTASRTVSISVASVDDAPESTVAPSISGPGIVDVDLTADPGTWNDLRDGGTSTITLTWVWQRSLSGGGWQDTGVTGPTYRPRTSDAGSRVRIMVSAANSDGPAIGTAVSAAVSICAATADDESRWVHFRENTYDGYGSCGTGALALVLGCMLGLLGLRRQR